MSFFGKYYFRSCRQVQDNPDAFKELMRSDVVEAWQPATDIYETEDGLVILTELAGVNHENLEVWLADDVLTIRGIRHEVSPRCKKSYRQMEIYHGAFERRLELPAVVSADRASSRMGEGMLAIFLPYADEETGRTVKLIVETVEKQ